ncbi:MAG TPA: monovalent cation/H+ antiporter complex subunit F, partial [Bacillota bacterium]|nr:monovalent cation/H+ antiporter complex subunit F [Bacillota bacterium]
VVSLDTFNMIVIGVIVVLASVFESNLYLDIAIVYSILAFLETVVFARYLEGKKNGNS